MLSFIIIQSLALPFLASIACAFDLDVSSPDSLKSTAKTLAGGIIGAYNSQPEGSVIGLFSGTGDPYWFWESGAVWNALIEYSYLTGDSQYDAIINEALRWQVGDANNFMPVNQTKVLANDDQSIWALAALTAAETKFPLKPEQGEWIDVAKNVFDDQVVRWDNRCDGGLQWEIFSFNLGYNYKNSASNVGFFLLAARLAKFTGNTTYEEWAKKSFEWLQDVGLVSEDYHVFDGTDANTNCEQINHIQWSAWHGLATEGAAIMYNLTNGGSKWKDAVAGFANWSSVFVRGNSSILFETACETNNKCDIGQKAYKGIAIRSFSRAALYAPFTSSSFHDMLEASAENAAESCKGEGKDLTCSFIWFEESEPIEVSDEGLGQAFNALGAVQALLYSDANIAPNGDSPNSANPTADPTVSGSASPSGAGTAVPADGTNAAGIIASIWAPGAFAGVLALLVIY
ncbi:mannan endo-1,6-alpha-mannosidase [Lojkania enalia]|uniref:Mannan endo-1,6-alpha-mannosidase n=1 Tax=Lojkania enalia TaxID=147567 RepID=A0A9P4K6B5_9PLEO|nr:mannan endo-1,6-alpha-mannosidase [Didymosphaeria enalia]